MDDRESLFGSPPPSPTRGRSPSLELALPAAAIENGINMITQNVGTIALPGSQHDSELPINPLALSLSYAPRPPAQAQTQAVRAEYRPSSSSTTPASSRASSAAPRPQHRKKTKRDVTNRPPPPEISLPDPSQPIPPNFLRNQSALLGTAGIVGGLNPAHINHTTLGSSPRHPIVISEDDSTHSHVGEEPKNLPTPTRAEIIYTLIKQKEIFPILAAILKHIAKARSQSQSATTEQRHSEDGRPSKRRKLRNVPAGAADWDRPYPFKEGEGPEEYHANWEKERTKRLISQLVSVIKTATQKAAAKNLVDHDTTTGFVQGQNYNPRYYKPSAFEYGAAPSTSSASTTSKDSRYRPAESPYEVHPLQEQSQPTQMSAEQSIVLEDLLTSLLNSQNEPPKIPSNGEIAEPDSSFWMSLFQTPPQHSSPYNDPFSFPLLQDPSCGTTPSLQQGELDNPQPQLDPALEPTSAVSDASFSYFDDVAIDPSLLALSIPSIAASTSDGSVWSSYPPSSMASPMASSFGDLEPLTPCSIDVPLDAKFGPSVQDSGHTAFDFNPLLSCNQDDAQDDGGKIGAHVDKGKQKEIPQVLPPRTAVPAPRLNKQEIIELAKQRRQQLAEELVKARTQLWETVIEGGVLANMKKSVR